MRTGVLLAAALDVLSALAATAAGAQPSTVGEKGGSGYLRDPRIDLRLIRKNDTVYRDYLQGVIHAP